MIKVNEKPIEYSLFLNNEIKIAPINIGEIWKTEPINISLIYENSIDIMNLIFVKKYLDDKYPLDIKNLIMKYIPYERMDRETENQMFTCKYFCQMINGLKFNKVVVLDPHSYVSEGILERVYKIPLIDNIMSILTIEKNDIIFLPDAGANKKYREILEKLNIPIIWGNKHRDLNTGNITDYEIIGDIDLKDKNVLIIDDICVKGYTTLFASKKLKECGAKKVIFYCSHCEDYIHTGELLKTDYVDKIYTTNSLIFDSHEKIKVLK